MKTSLCLAVLNSENRRFHNKVLKRVKKWNKGFERGKTPDPHLRWSIDYLQEDFHNITNEDQKVHILESDDSFTTTTFMKKFVNYTIVVNEEFVNRILAEIKSFTTDNLNVEQIAEHSYLAEWLNINFGKTIYMYSIRYTDSSNDEEIK